MADTDALPSATEFIIETAIIGIVAAIVYWIAHDWVPAPISFFDVWHAENGSMLDGLLSVWYIFAWGTAITLMLSLVLCVKKIPREQAPLGALAEGTLLSFIAGIFEEINYRWFRLLLAIFALALLNVVTFGIVEWIYVHWLMPGTNFLTFGLLSEYFVNPASWLIGAAIISANGDFQEAHKYLGWFGLLNSWFIGIILFYLTFTYGLLTAIVAHIVYDLCVFTTGALMLNFRPKPVYARMYF